MAYLEEIKDVNLTRYSKNNYSISFIANCIIIEGSYRIICYENFKIEVQTKKDTLSFLGENFTIVYASKDELIIQGNLLELKKNV